MKVSDEIIYETGKASVDIAKRKELKNATRHKRHRIHIPKNTTINVDIEK